MQSSRERLLSEITQIIEEPVEEEKENINVTLGIMGDVFFALSSSQGTAAASVWLEKLSKVTLETLDQFTKELATLEALQQEEKQKTSITDEDRLQIRKIAEWIAQLKDSATHQLSGLPDFIFTAADKKNFLSILHERLQRINAALLKHAEVDENTWLAEKEAVFKKTLSGNKKWYFRKLEKDKIVKEIAELKLSLDNQHIYLEHFNQAYGPLRKRLKLFLEFPPGIDEPDPNGVTSLIRAVKSGNLLRVTRLIAKGANLNLKNSKNETALICALNNNKYDLIRLLILAGADLPDQRYGYDPRLSAMRWQTDEILQEVYEDRDAYLLSDRFTFEELLSHLKRPDQLKKLMLYALKKKRWDVVLSIMHRHSKDQLLFLTEPRLIQEIGEGLKALSSPSLVGSILGKILKMNPALPPKMQKLLGEIKKHYAELRKLSSSPSSILKAVNNSEFSLLVSSLTAVGSRQFNIRDQHGRTLLDLAYTRKLAYKLAYSAETSIFQEEEKKEEREEKEEKEAKEEKSRFEKRKKDSEKIFLFLLTRSNINARTTNNQTLLHLAVLEQAPLGDLVLLLLKNANPEARDNAGKKPLDYLLDKKGQLKDDRLLDAKNILEKGLGYLFEPENESLLDTVLQYWEKGSGPKKQQALSLLANHFNIQDEDGNTAFMRAIIKKQWSLAKRLLENREIHVHLKNNNGQNAFLLAMSEGPPEVVELVLAQFLGPDQPIRLSFKDKQMALVMAIRRGEIELVKLALRSGANPSLGAQHPLSPDNQSALSIAVCGYQLEIVKLLLAEGANPDEGGSSNYHDPLRTAIGLAHIDPPASLRIKQSKIIGELIRSGAQLYDSLLNNLSYYNIHIKGQFMSHLSGNSGYSSILLKMGYSLEDLSYRLKYPTPIKQLADVALKQKKPYVLINIINHNAEHLDKLPFLAKDPFLKVILRFLKENSTYAPAFKLAILQKLRKLINIDEITNLEKHFQSQGQLQPLVKSKPPKDPERPQTNLPTDEKTLDKNTVFDKKIILTATLLDAVCKNNEAVLSVILDNNPDLELNQIKDDQGRTLLDLAYKNLLACRSPAHNTEEEENAKKIFSLLLTHPHADVRTANGQTLIHLAVINQAPLADLVLFLLKNVSPHAKDTSNKTALDYFLEQDPSLKNNRLAYHTHNILVKGFDYLFEHQNLPLWEDILKSWKNGNGPGKEEAELLLSTHLNKLDANGNTALMRSVVQRNPYLTKRLLQLKPPLQLDIKNAYHENALILAVLNRQTKIASLLLDQGADPDTMNNNISQTVLKMAVNGGHLDLVKLLLSHGANPEIGYPTALGYAVKENHLEIARELIAAGARPVGLTSNPSEAMYQLVQPLHYSENYVDYLLKQGHLLNEKMGYSLEDLSYRLKYPTPIKQLADVALKQKKPYVLINIINHNAKHLDKLPFLAKDPFLKVILRFLKENSTYAPAFKLAILQKLRKLINIDEITNLEKHFQSQGQLHAFIQNKSIVKSKLPKDPERPQTNLPTDEKTLDKNTVFDKKIILTATLLDAVCKNNEAVLSVILNNNPDLELSQIKDDQGRTLLDLAYRNLLACRSPAHNTEEEENAKKIFSLLLTHPHADVRTANGQTLIHLAVINQAPLADLVLFLLKNVSPHAKDSSNKTALDYFFEQDPSLNKNPPAYHTHNILVNGFDYLFEHQNLPLWEDILKSWQNGNGPGKEEAELLLSTHLNKLDANGNTALMRSVLQRNPYLTKRLLQLKPPLQLDIKNADHENALILAVKNGQTKIASLLLDQGADPDTMNNNISQTALTMAVNGGHLDLVKLLLSHGANPETGSPVLGAIKNHHLEIARELIAAGARPGLLILRTSEATYQLVQPLYDSKNYVDYLLKQGHLLNELPCLLHYPHALKKLATYALDNRHPHLIIDIINHHSKQLKKLSFLIEEPFLKAILHHLKENYTTTPAFRLAILGKIEDLIPKDPGTKNERNKIKIEKIKRDLLDENSLYTKIQQDSAEEVKTFEQPQAFTSALELEKKSTGYPAFFDKKIVTTAKVLDAVYKNNFSLLDNMISQNPRADLNIINNEGRHLLDLAYEALLARRSPTTRNDDRQREEGERRKNEEILFLLLAKSDVNRRTIDNQNLLHLAMRNSETRTHDIILFLLAGVDSTARDKDNKKPLDYLNEDDPSPNKMHDQKLLEQGLDYLWTLEGGKLLSGFVAALAEKPQQPGAEWMISQLEFAAKNSTARSDKKKFEN